MGSYLHKTEYAIGFFYKFYLLNIIEALKYHCLKNSIYIELHLGSWEGYASQVSRSHENLTSTCPTFFFLILLMKQVQKKEKREGFVY